MIITITKDPPVPILPKTENFAIVDLDPVEVARQMTLIEFDIYAAVRKRAGEGEEEREEREERRMREGEKRRREEIEEKWRRKGKRARARKTVKVNTESEESSLSLFPLLQIQPKECLNMTWTKAELKHSHSPNIMRSIARFNQVRRRTSDLLSFFLCFLFQVSMFVMTSLVSELDLRKRIALFEHFVKIAVALRELKNFNGCLEIISGMHHSVRKKKKKREGERESDVCFFP